MDRGFIVLFSGKEGSTALVRTLDNMDDIDVVHHADGLGWEPFDKRNRGDLTASGFADCMRHIYTRKDWAAANAVYRQASGKDLSAFDPEKCIGFKMRYTIFINGLMQIAPQLGTRIFVLFRTDLLRWGLSKYHGDGTGRDGHLQFAVAAGKKSLDEIPKITVEAARLTDIIEELRAINDRKIAVLEKLAAAGARVSILSYEDMLQDNVAFYAGIRDILGLGGTTETVKSYLERPMPFKKVHSDDINSFVENAGDVLRAFEPTVWEVPEPLRGLQV